MKHITLFFSFSLLFTQTTFSLVHATEAEPKSTASISRNISRNTGTPLLSIAKNNQEALKLSEKQKTAISLWFSNTANHLRVLVSKKITLDKSIERKALNGDNKKAIMSKLEQINSLQTEIVSRQLDCRNNLQNILDKNQWSKLIRVYKTETK